MSEEREHRLVRIETSTKKLPNLEWEVARWTCSCGKVSQGMSPQYVRRGQLVHAKAMARAVRKNKD